MAAPRSVPPAPEGWNKTIDDLCAEMSRGERKSIGSPELDWARNFERSLISAEARFPRQGDLYEALEDLQVRFLTYWMAPYTGGGEGLLRKGDQVRVEAEPIEEAAISTSMVAVDYAGVEKRMVPESDRTAPKYSGYSLVIKTVDLNRRFRLVSSVHSE